VRQECLASALRGGVDDGSVGWDNGGGAAGAAARGGVVLLAAARTMPRFCPVDDYVFDA